MSRSPALLRSATAEDALFLADLWGDLLRRADHQDQVSDVELIIKTAESSPERRLVIAEYDGQPAGAVLLVLSTLSPLDLEPVVQVFTPCVAPGFRRHGLGHLLMEAAVSFAEEVGAVYLASAARADSRSGNRFLARLGFGSKATLRVVATPLLRGRLTAQRPGRSVPTGGRQVGQILAARRSLRRSQVPD